MTVAGAGAGAEPPDDDAPARLQLDGITKRFPAVVANEGVSLRVMPGEIHAVLGENGAGKSTLMKIVYGAVRPDAGTIRWDGAPVEVHGPAQSRALGIAMVFQHFSLFETLTVAQNVLLGLGGDFPIERVRAGIRAMARDYELDLDPERPVHSLSVGERQRVEIVRALLSEPKLLIMDEPTSVLAPAAVDRLFVLLRRLAERGCSVLYVSHKLDEIRALCHRCTVLRGGRVVAVVDPTRESTAALSRMMIDAEPAPLEHRALRRGERVLDVRELSLARAERFGVELQSVSLDVHAGEIVGIAGVSGNGQRELLAALSGEDARARPDSIVLGGEPAGARGPRWRRERGLRFVPEERLGRGAVPELSLAENVLLTRTREVAPGALGWIARRAAASIAARVVERFDVKAAGPLATASSLSGGNLQKFIVGREIDAHPQLLVLAQPTWGVDVGAAARIRAALLGLRDAGCAVLVVSEDLDELFELADRLHVIARGRLSPPLERAAATVEVIGQWMSGLWPGGAGGGDGGRRAA